MNIDDPKLTAFALNELSESEQSTVAREIVHSPEAQRFVDETHELAQALRNEFANEIREDVATGLWPVKVGRTAPWLQRPENLSDIRDDPWFWSVGRPLAIAAGITIFAILGALAIATYLQSDSSAATTVNLAEVEGEENSQTGAPLELSGPTAIPNPLPADAIQRIDRVVIGELDVDRHLKDGEIHVIETINDAYRLQRLKKRLATLALSKKSQRGLFGRAYQLMFLDRDSHVVASAGFYWSPGFGFVLQPSRYGYERDGHYFVGRGDTVLPGDWESGIDYVGYIIPFSDWLDGIGYCPGT